MKRRTDSPISARHPVGFNGADPVAPDTLPIGCDGSSSVTTFVSDPVCTNHTLVPFECVMTSTRSVSIVIRVFFPIPHRPLLKPFNIAADDARVPETKQRNCV